jgi:Ca2+-binding RTX toxin-like protein
MARNQILIDSQGKIWRNASGQILRNRPFNEMPLQDGLVFWGAADPDYLTLVDGRVSEAYDIRGTGVKMIQNTVASRLSYNNLGFIFATGDSQSFGATISTRSAFIVIARTNGLGGTSNVMGITNNGSLFSSGLGTASANVFIVGGTSYSLLANETFAMSPIASNLNQVYVLVGDFPTTATGLLMHTAHTGGARANIYEWGAYDRVLSLGEKIYISNAINARYNLY